MKLPPLSDLIAATRQIETGKLADVTSRIMGLLRPGGSESTRTNAPPGARWFDGEYTDTAGTRPYRLYVPAAAGSGRAMPLVAVLHGCTQTARDIAAGTRFAEAAEEHRFIAVFPEQITSANIQRCWNWFRPADQARDGGEPSLIAGIVRSVMARFAVDARRVYAAGMSAGGAEVSVLADTYPDLFAAVGVHSGLASGLAQDMPSAYAAMQHGRRKPPPRHRDARTRFVPTIVFHGDQDRVVNPLNAEGVVHQAMPEGAVTARTRRDQVARGHAYTVTRFVDGAGREVVQKWIVEGAGHAWSGGSESGSYTDPRGPDATAAMVRFFLSHAL